MNQTESRYFRFFIQGIRSGSCSADKKESGFFTSQSVAGNSLSDAEVAVKRMVYDLLRIKQIEDEKLFGVFELIIDECEEIGQEDMYDEPQAFVWYF